MRYKFNVFALEGLQIPEMWSPCSVGSIFFIDSCARWEYRKRFLRPLCGENAIKTRFLNISTWFFHFCKWDCPGGCSFCSLFSKLSFPPSVGITFPKFMNLGLPKQVCLFVLFFKNVSPAQRRDHTSEIHASVFYPVFQKCDSHQTQGLHFRSSCIGWLAKMCFPACLRINLRHMAESQLLQDLC